MSIPYSPASQVMLRHQSTFLNRYVLFAGDIQDLLPCHFSAAQVNVHLTAYQWYQQIDGKVNGHVEFSFLPDKCLFKGINTLIYYWPKNKLEAQCQLSNFLHSLTPEVDIFVIGENRTGVRSCEKLLAPFGIIKKMDTARRCSLYHFQANKRVTFSLNAWLQNYRLLDDLTIHTVPGVFSACHLDAGSAILLDALFENQWIITGNVLDVGCGAGVLSVAMAKINPSIKLTLSDTNAAALIASRRTLAANHVQGNIVASDVFSDIDGQFNLIISNPPFHDGGKVNYTVVESLINNARNHLTAEGYLCIVANAFLPYAQLFEAVFNNYQILLQTGKFKVYLAKC